MSDFAALRQQMVEYQMAARGLDDEAVLKAINAVPREAFVPTELVEFAYNDSPLPIAASQTISQPYIVALMTAALELKPEDRVLEVGTGSGYAAAVLAEIASDVYSIQRHKILADSARERLEELGYPNILHAYGTLGWPEHAPFDAIVVAAGGPDVPTTLKEQLAIGGRLVIPVGASLHSQKLLRVRRISAEQYHQEDLGDVRFVPLIGAAGWEEDTSTEALKKAQLSLPELIYQSSEHFANISDVKLDNLMQRIGDSRLVLLGEASHGTVAAASEWGGPMEVKQVQPAHMDSYEHVCHEVNTDNFLLPLRQPLQNITRTKLLTERLERAIGVIYRPETELQSHCFYASLPRQFDEYIWFDESSAVTPLNTKTRAGMPDTFPFGV